MRFLLTAKHWQVFLLLMVVLFLGDVAVEDSPLARAFQLTGTFLFLLWPMLVAQALQAYLPRQVEISNTFFLINGFVVILVLIGSGIVAEGESISFNGLAAIPFFYILFAIFYYFSFPGRLLRAIENRKDNSGLSERLVDFVLTFCLPIGIWFLQPRINQVVAKSESSEQQNEAGQRKSDHAPTGE
jgi:predicted Na+-dependent transporter